MNREFVFVYGNHGWAPAVLHDFYGLLHDLVLFSSGRKLRTSPQPVAGCVNFLIEMFNLDDLKRIQAVKSGDPQTRLVVLCTEFLTDNTFNGFDLVPPGVTRGLRRFTAAAVPAGWKQKLSASRPDFAYAFKHRFWRLTGGSFHRITRLYDDWKERYDFFHAGLAYMNEVWYLSEAQAGGYQAVVEPDKLWQLPLVPYLPLGRSPEPSAPPPDRDIDFLFTGSLTDYRRSKVTELLDRGLRVEVAPVNTPEYIREDLLRRARACLHLKLRKDWPFASGMRLHHLLLAGKYVVCEETADRPVQTRFVDWQPSERLVSACERILASPRLDQQGLEWRQKYYEQTQTQREVGKEHFCRLFDLR